MRAAGKEATPEAQNRGRGYGSVAGLARSGPGAARASLMSIFAQDLDPGLPPESVASRFWTVVIRNKEDRMEAADHNRSRTRNQRWIDFLRSTGGQPQPWGRPVQCPFSGKTMISSVAVVESS